MVCPLFCSAAIIDAYTEDINKIKLHWLLGFVGDATFFRTTSELSAHVVCTGEVGRNFLDYFLSDVFHCLFVIALIKNLDGIQLSAERNSCLGINRFDEG